MGVNLLAGEKQDRESNKAVQACNDYLRMGPGRSLQKLHRTYTESAPDQPPTRHLRTLKEWSSSYGWQARVDLYDAEIERKKNKEVEKRRQQALEAGFALDHERVIALKKLASLLLGQIYERDEDGNHPRVWVPDVKQIGSGDQAERVDIVRFNAAIISELRSALDDIAKEVGGRRQKSDIRNLNLDMSQLTDEQLKRIAAGEDPFAVLSTSG